MKKIGFLCLFALALTTTYGQAIDYNTRKGAVAEGYDVVSYFEGTPAKGSSNYKTTYNDAEFRFSTEAHLKAFQQNPEKYVPQYGGYCAYAIASGKKVRVDPETYEIRDGKLYLFYNAHGTNTLELWQEEGAEKLQVKADRIWEEIKFKG